VSRKERDETLSWSRDGRRLAVGAKHGVRVIELASGRVRQLTRGWDTEARWSPTKMMIAFRRIRTVNRIQHGTIYLIRADGTGLQTVTRPSVNVQGFDFSPDGSSIAFVTRTEVGSVCDGKTEREPPPVWPLSVLDVATRRSRQITPNSGAYLNPQFSPDGALIAVSGWTCETRRHLFPWRPYVLDRDGENLRHVPSGDYFAWVPMGP
jgi:Tol biopolymer transport system component